MIDWKIQARARACQACSKAFADKEAYFTLLFDRKNSLERWDVCATCWESQYSQGANDRKGFVSFWQGVFVEPPPGPPEPIQKESAESLLRKLVEQNEAPYAAACFILAVMLERKRVLRVKAQSTQDGQRTLLYEHARTGDLFSIVDPNLQLQQLEEVQRTVTELLEHGLNPVASAPASVVEPVPTSGIEVSPTNAPTTPAAEGEAAAGSNASTAAKDSAVEDDDEDANAVAGDIRTAEGGGPVQEPSPPTAAAGQSMPAET